MTGAERARRHRSLKALRRQAEDEALSAEFAGSYGDREVSVRLCDFILTGLTCENEQAVRTLAVFLAGLPAELAELRRDLDEILADREKAPTGAAGARGRSAGQTP